jgi:hypothetical protein
MPPKTEFTIPMGDVVQVVTKTRRSKREVRTTEKVALQHSYKHTKSGTGSESRSHIGLDMQPSGNPSQNLTTEEVHTIQLLEAQEDDGEDLQTGPGESNVCARMSF